MGEFKGLDDVLAAGGSKSAFLPKPVAPAWWDSLNKKWYGHSGASTCGLRKELR